MNIANIFTIPNGNEGGNIGQVSIQPYFIIMHGTCSVSVLSALYGNSVGLKLN